MGAAGLPERLAGRLARGRAMAEARMLSECTIRHKTGKTAQNETTGRVEPIWAVVYTGKCRVRGGRTGTGYRVQTTPAGDRAVGVPEIHLPCDTTGVSGGDLIEITAGERAGTVWRVLNADAADQQSAYRLPTEGTARPKEWS